MTDVKVDTLCLDGFSMDYCRFGRGQTPLIILPGLSLQRVMGSAKAIAGAYRLLADDFTIYVFERRNDMPDTYPISDMARDTASALEALDIGSACLFGASQGGMIAMEIAITRPRLVRRMIVGSSSARVTPEVFERFVPWIQMAREEKAGELLLMMSKALYPREVFEPLRPLLLEMAEGITAEDFRRFIIQTEAIRGFDRLDDVNKIACPVLVIGARDDRVLDGESSVQIAERLADRPDCALYMYDQYGHAVYDLAPDYRQRMRSFFVSCSHRQ